MEEPEAQFQIGRVNRLEVCTKAPQGVYLIGPDSEILLPNRQVPEGTEVGDELDVFIYTDSEDRLIATQIEPKVQWDEVACLRVKEVTGFGAFLDWGLDKDLLIPMNEQLNRLEENDLVVVLVCLDEDSDRLYATTRMRDYFYSECLDYERGQEVDYIVHELNEHGAQVIIDQAFRGMFYKDDLTRDLDVGDTGKGYIKTKRPDGKLKLCFQKPGYGGIIEVKPKILLELKENGGFLPLNDSSDPNDIRDQLAMSKKAFKKAIGSLYKDGRIMIEDEGIRLKVANKKPRPPKGNES